MSIESLIFFFHDLQISIKGSDGGITVYFSPPLVLALSGKGNLYQTDPRNFAYTTILLGKTAPEAFKYLVGKMCDEIGEAVDFDADFDDRLTTDLRKYVKSPVVEGAWMKIFLRECDEPECVAAWKNMGITFLRPTVPCKKAWRTHGNTWLDGVEPSKKFFQLDTTCKIDRISFYGENRFTIWGQQRNGVYRSKVDDSMDDDDMKMLLK